MTSRTVLPLAALAAAALLTTGAFAFAAGPHVPGNAVRGKALFLRPGLFCASCHTLKAAKSTGRDGPNLDRAKPSYAKIVERVTNGRNPTRRWPTGMPSYSGQHAFVTKAQIRDIAAFVYTATHR
jgi:mono/diheme cytochrome c family protein